ncbi:hypothetical protein ABZU53_04770 [Micromonospora sp. NPDC005194]
MTAWPWRALPGRVYLLHDLGSASAVLNLRDLFGVVLVLDPLKSAFSVSQ